MSKNTGKVVQAILLHTSPYLKRTGQQLYSAYQRGSLLRHTHTKAQNGPMCMENIWKLNLKSMEGKQDVGFPKEWHFRRIKVWTHYLVWNYILVFCIKGFLADMTFGNATRFLQLGMEVKELIFICFEWGYQWVCSLPMNQDLDFNPTKRHM